MFRIFLYLIILPLIAFADTGEYTKYARIRATNKMMGNSLTFKVAVGDNIHYFENVRFMVEKCWKADFLDVPESKAYLKIWINNNEDKQVALFSGWMFAHQSSLTSMEDRLYDFGLIECIN